MRKILVFIIHKFRADTMWEQGENAHATHWYAELVKAAGAVPVCVQEMWERFGIEQFSPDNETRDKTDDPYWLDACKAVLERCDCAIAIPPFTSGCQGELRFCAEYGIDVYTLPTRDLLESQPGFRDRIIEMLRERFASLKVQFEGREHRCNGELLDLIVQQNIDGADCMIQGMEESRALKSMLDSFRIDSKPFSAIRTMQLPPETNISAGQPVFHVPLEETPEGCFRKENGFRPCGAFCGNSDCKAVELARPMTATEAADPVKRTEFGDCPCPLCVLRRSDIPKSIIGGGRYA